MEYTVQYWKIEYECAKKRFDEACWKNTKLLAFDEEYHKALHELLDAQDRLHAALMKEARA